MKAKINGKLLASFKDAPFVVWDSDTKGLFARRQTEGGRATYAWRYKTAEGRAREIKLGDASTMAPDLLDYLVRVPSVQSNETSSRGIDCGGSSSRSTSNTLSRGMSLKSLAMC